MSSSNAFAILAGSDEDEDIESKYMTSKAKQNAKAKQAEKEERDKRVVPRAKPVTNVGFTLSGPSMGSTSAGPSAPRNNQNNTPRGGHNAGHHVPHPPARRADPVDRSDRRAFRRNAQVVTIEPSTNTVVLRLHQTDIVKIKPNGDVILNSGGWKTVKTQESMNDALEPLGMKVTGHPYDGWIVDDGHDNRYRYADDMLVPHKTDEDRYRASIMLEEYGVTVPAALRPREITSAALRPGRNGQTQFPAEVAARGTIPVPPPPAAAPAVHRHPHGAISAAQAQAMVGPKGDPLEVAKQVDQLAAEMNHTHLEGVEEEDICTVCWERLREMVLIPCGHLVLCGECFEEIMEKPEKLCPMCRQEIIEALPVTAG